MQKKLYVNLMNNVRFLKQSFGHSPALCRAVVGVCALHGHFCKIDRILASTRRLLQVIGTYSFI
ncbi:MAG: hypothetical protein LH606_06825 [Cytophagaceae bacterium]|nr:hypothetical protein [Cytophagaceae bacterium]